MNADEPAFPFDWKDFQPHSGEQVVREQFQGLSARAYMATKFAAAIIGNAYVSEMMGEAKKHMTPQQQHDFDNKIAPFVTSKAAVALADALIKELSNK